MDWTRARRSRAGLVMMTATILAAAGCGDKSTAGAGGTGGTGTATGGGGTAGAPGTGGAGGAPSGCVAPAAFAAAFTIADASFCAVAVYTVDEVPGSATWGAHHGPLTAHGDTGGMVTLERWTAPAGATGSLTKQTTTVDAKIPADAFFGGAASDLPFYGWTAVSWTGANAPYAGQLVMIKGGAIDHTYALDGAYAVGGVGADAGGRALYTGQSALGAGAAGANALYGADTCAAATPDVGCAPTQEVAAWGEASGPVAVDKDGNAFAVMSSFSSGTQEARGFAAALVGHGAAPSAGVTLFTLPGFGSSLAAIRPVGAEPGLLVFQPFDATTFAPIDVVAQRYTTAGALAAQGAPAKLLSVPATTTAGFSLMTDDADRLWVAVPGDKSTLFVVLDRQP